MRDMYLWFYKGVKIKNISVNYEKPSFLKKIVKHLGKIINKEGIKANTSAVIKL